jgi:hypothetical protein
MMNARYLQDEDYEKLTKWWDGSGFPAPPKNMLPENGTGGIMIQKSDRDICAGFVYFTNSKIAWIEFIVADPTYRESDRSEAIMLLINTLKILAKDTGYNAIFTSVKNSSLISKYEACGFIKGDSNSQEMILNVKH